MVAGEINQIMYDSLRVKNLAFLFYVRLDMILLTVSFICRLNENYEVSEGVSLPRFVFSLLGLL